MFNRQQLKQLQQKGLIRGFRIPERKKGYSQEGIVKRDTLQKPKAILWLDMNLQLWSNDHALLLEMEYRFCTDRKWRFDYAWPAIKLALEYNGGIFMQKSGHSNMKGLHRDSEKINRATVEGWKVLQVTALNYTTVLKTLNEII
jgi:hypothetical protein